MRKGKGKTYLLHSGNSVNQDCIPFEGHDGDWLLARLLDDSNSEYKLVADAKYTSRWPDKQQLKVGSVRHWFTEAIERAQTGYNKAGVWKGGIYSSRCLPSKNTFSWSSTANTGVPRAASNLAVSSSDASLILISISMWEGDDVDVSKNKMVVGIHPSIRPHLHGARARK